MKIINHPNEFKTGYRILMRKSRTKDGIKASGDRKSKKVITNGPEEYDACFEQLCSELIDNERIYGSVDARDFNKAIREFKRRLLESDYGSVATRDGFYRDSKNQVVSCLQGPAARATHLFLWDCDSIEDYDNCLRALHSACIVPKHFYTTKNGGHIITEPFEYPKLMDPLMIPWLHKNAMMLLAY